MQMTTILLIYIPYRLFLCCASETTAVTTHNTPSILERQQSGKVWLANTDNRKGKATQRGV